MIVQFEQLSNLIGIRFVITAAANRGSGSGSSVTVCGRSRERERGPTRRIRERERVNKEIKGERTNKDENKGEHVVSFLPRCPPPSCV